MNDSDIQLAVVFADPSTASPFRSGGDSSGERGSSLQTAGAVVLAAASDFLTLATEQATNVWPLTRLIALGDMWMQGLSTRQIGLLLGCSKNSVIGKAHRLELPCRPSPITGRTARVRPVRQRKVRTLPALPSAPPPPPARIAGCLPPPPRPAPAPPPPRPPAVLRGQTLSPCQWPFGEPRTKSFRFCGDIAIPGRPYCSTHLRKAYQPREKEQLCA